MLAAPLNQPATATAVYYRPATDRDGSVTYSPVQVLSSAPTSAPQLTAFPVPAREVLNAAFADSGNEVFLRLTNQQGQTVVQQPLRRQAQFNLRGLPPACITCRRWMRPAGRWAKPKK